MPKFANVVTIEVAPGRRDQVVTLLLAHKARLKDEPGTLQFEVLLPKDDDTKVRVYEMYRDAAAFEVHLNGQSFMGCGAQSWTSRSTNVRQTTTKETTTGIGVPLSI
jgi:quinol monooxygenase YgiN